MTIRGALAAVRDAAVALRHPLLLVSDRAGWALDEQTRRIAANLPPEVDAAVVGSVPGWLRGRTVHFVNRYAAFERDAALRLASRDRVIVTWTHGGAVPDTTAELRALLEDMRRVGPRVDLVHVQSTLYVPVIEGLGVDPRRIRLAPLGVDLERFTPADGAARRAARSALGLPPGAPVIGSFQRDGEDAPKLVKGPDVLVEAAARLRATLPDLVVLLTGPARGWVRRALADRGVRAVHLGVVPVDRLVACHRACDLYLIPAREEGGPLALLEAMATGTPVVSTRVGMSVDVITDGVDGALVGVGDAAALAERALALLRDEAARAAVGAAAAATARRFGWASVGRTYAERLYLDRNSTPN